MDKLVLIKKTFVYFIILLLFYFIQNPVRFSFFSVTTFRLMSVIGVILLFVRFLMGYKNKLNIYLFSILISSILIVVYFISCFLNDFMIDFDWLNTNLVFIFSLFSFEIIFYIAKKNNIMIDIELITNLLAFSAFFRLLIGLVLFLQPSFYNLLSFVFAFSNSMVSHFDVRIVSLGFTFFGAGVFNSFVLVLLSYMIVNNRFKTIKLYVFLSLFILVIGMLESRTTIIGFIVGILYFFCKISIKNIKRIIKILKVLFRFFWISSIVLYILFFNKNFANKVVKLANFGYEIFINYAISGEMTSASTNAMKNMYHFPTLGNYHTWLIGDGKFGNDLKGYYKHTDIGYCRIIYCNGIIGLLVFLFTQWLWLKNGIKEKELNYCLFLLLLILNLKGVTTFTLLVSPFYFIDKFSIGHSAK